MKYNPISRMFVPDPVSEDYIKQTQEDLGLTYQKARTKVFTDEVDNMRYQLEEAMAQASVAMSDSPPRKIPAFYDVGGKMVNLTAHNAFVAGMRFLCRTIGMGPCEIYEEVS